MNSKRTRCLDSITPTWNLDQVIAELRQSREHTHNVRHLGRIRELPSRKAVLQVLDGLCAVLFPTHYGRTDLHSGNIDYFVGDQLHVTLSDLQDQVRKGLLFVSDRDPQDDPCLVETAIDITTSFAAQLPAIRGLLFSDLQAAYRGDPAATSPFRDSPLLSRHDRDHVLPTSARTTSRRCAAAGAFDLGNCPFFNRH